MTPDTYINTLLKKYQIAPSFPFDDWVENSVSFYALINIWDEIFKTAAGSHKGDYIALGDAQQDEYSFIYQVKHKAQNVVFVVTPSWPALETKVGGDFAVLHTVYPPELQPMDDKFELGVNSDLDRDRLVCLFQIVRQFTHDLPKNGEDVAQFNESMIAQFGRYFGYPNYNPFNSPLFPITESDETDEDD